MSDERDTRMEEKLDKVVEHIYSINTTLAAQHVSLKEHMRRTELLEADVAPLKARAIKIDGALKLIGYVAGIIAFSAGIVEIVSFILRK